MGHLLQLKCGHSPLNQRILSSTSVPFTFTTVQVPNLALTHTKRFTVRRISCGAFACHGGIYYAPITGKILYLSAGLQFKNKRSQPHGWDLANCGWDLAEQSRNSPGFDPSILQHSGIWGAAEKAVLNKAIKKSKKILLFKKTLKNKRLREFTFSMLKGTATWVGFDWPFP